VDPEDLDWGFYRNNAPDCEAKELAKRFGIKLGPDFAVMCKDKMSGDFLYMIKSTDGKYYIWNQIEDGVWEIMMPSDESVII
jgi:hypothetical protein